MNEVKYLKLWNIFTNSHRNVLNEGLGFYEYNIYPAIKNKFTSHFRPKKNKSVLKF